VSDPAESEHEFAIDAVLEELIDRGARLDAVAVVAAERGDLSLFASARHELQRNAAKLEDAALAASIARVGFYAARVRAKWDEAGFNRSIEDVLSDG
jgi:hypothetical protein